MFNTTDAPPRSEGSATGNLARKVQAHIKLARAKKKLTYMSAILDDLIQFGSLGPTRTVRRLLALQKKGINITRITSGNIAETHIRAASPAQHEYLERLKNQLHEKAHSAIRRKNPHWASNKVDPSYDRTGGTGWESIYQRWIKGSDQNIRRATKASGFMPLD